MKKILFLVLIFFPACGFSKKYNSLHFQNHIDIAKKRCTLDNNKETVQIHPMPWWMTFQQIEQIFFQRYNSPKRLPNKAYYDPEKQTFILPLFNKPVNIEIKEFFILSVISHIEKALEKKYADFINFTDMGHSHILIPENDYKTELVPYYLTQPFLSDEQYVAVYTKLLSSENNKFLYHTAERLKITGESLDHQITPASGNQEKSFLNKEYLLYRYLNRNIIGSNTPEEDLEVVQVQDLHKTYNTVKKVEGYRYWGSGYYMHSNQNGCFPYRKDNETYYFDISLEYEY